MEYINGDNPLTVVVLPLAIVFGPPLTVLIIGTLVQFIRYLESDGEDHEHSR